MHNGAIVIRTSKGIDVKSATLPKLTNSIPLNVAFQELHIVIPVWSTLFMPHSKGVAYLVKDKRLFFTTRSKVYRLSATYSTDIACAASILTS